MTIETGLPAVKVKALEWRDGRTDETVFHVVQRATILGAEDLIGLEYTILGPDRHGLFEVILGDKIINYGNSEEQAKTVAQLDYERRILSALTLKDDPGNGGDTVTRDELSHFIRDKAESHKGMLQPDFWPFLAMYLMEEFSIRRRPQKEG